ncbi:MAG: hypothetical protein HWN80_05520 [Candidatus Lokiarchaeota archaeon]|nr:hypothetical protein [Candidatus Lokiarchaeota archaeon]
MKEQKYIQMRLLVEEIEKAFEDKLREKIEHSIILAEIREANKDNIDSIINLHDKS